MAATILDGKALAQQINDETKAKVEKLNQQVTLAVIYDPNNKASDLYVGMKKRAAKKVGIATKDIEVNESQTTEDVLAILDSLNNDANVTGILVQSPLPKQVSEEIVFAHINPKKDADGLSAINQGLLFANAKAKYIAPATPKGCMTILERYHIDPKGKKALVIGRSQLFGRPMASLLLNADATVTIAHRATDEKTLKKLVKEADIVAIGVGIPHFLSGDDFKEDAIVLDVGMNVVDNKAVGDVDFAQAKEKVAYITPVPGGVGPMTIATLLQSTVELGEENA